MYFTNRILLFIWLISAMYWLQPKDYSVDAQQIEGYFELLPQSAVQILDNGPFGLRYSPVTLVLLSSALLVTLFGLGWAYAKIGKHETRDLGQTFASEKRSLNLKEEELKLLRHQLQRQKEASFQKERKLLAKLSQYASRQADLEDERDRLETQVFELEEIVEEANSQLADKQTTLSQKRRRHVYFKEDPEVFIFNKAEPAERKKPVKKPKSRIPIPVVAQGPANKPSSRIPIPVV